MSETKPPDTRVTDHFETLRQIGIQIGYGFYLRAYLDFHAEYCSDFARPHWENFAPSQLNKIIQDKTHPFHKYYTLRTAD